MSQVSKYPLSDDVADRIFGILIKTLTTIKDKHDANDFADDFFSPTEKIMLAKRLSIAFLLLRKYEYRDIVRILKVSSTTIASVNVAMRKGKGIHRKILEKIMNEESMEEFFRKTSELLLSIPASAGKGGGAWRYLKNEVNKSKKTSVF